MSSRHDDQDSDSDTIDTLELLRDSTQVVESIDRQANESQLVVALNQPSEILNEEDKEESVEQQHQQEIPHKIEENEFQDKPKAIAFKTNFSYGYDSDEEIRTDDLKHLEPKLRDAWIEMRRLDKMLKTVSDKERRIKRETRQLVEKNRIELELIKMTSDRKETKQEQENTQHFLALSCKDSDKKDKDENESDNDDLHSSLYDTLSPVFQTQLPENERNNQSQSLKGDKEDHFIDESQRTTPINKGPSSSSNNYGKTSSTKSTKLSFSSKLSNKDNKNKDKDFIKRNIELAQDTGGTLALTETEKKRLQELLEDDALNDKEIQIEKDELTQNINEIVHYNPSEIVLMPGEGFKPNMNELERLREIDSKLEKRISSSLMGRNTSRISGILSSQRGSSFSIEAESYRSLLSLENKKIKLNDEFDENTFGDKFIRETRITREEQQRLRLIDKQLEDLRTPSCLNDNDQLNTDRSGSKASNLIDEVTLQNLLDECSIENKKVVSVINNFKLGTVKEEEDCLNDNINNLDLNYVDDVHYDDIQLTEGTIRTLLEQAKQEGIVSDGSFTKEEEEIEKSLYEEALEILKNRPMRQISINNNELNEDSYKSILPRIESSNRLTQRQTDSPVILSRSNSSISGLINESSQSFTLPKIDSRFLANDFK